MFLRGWWRRGWALDGGESTVGEMRAQRAVGGDNEEGDGQRYRRRAEVWEVWIKGVGQQRGVEGGGAGERVRGGKRQGRG
eukprot:11360-Chlamydomonas_euryale.AAC.2